MSFFLVGVVLSGSGLKGKKNRGYPLPAEEGIFIFGRGCTFGEGR